MSEWLYVYLVDGKHVLLAEKRADVRVHNIVPSFEKG